MKLPDFLIIGAMKAGTTSLYEDLLAIPGLWLPPQKEPEDLADPSVETPEGRARYAAKYARCPQGALAGDASTAYAKLPTYPGVAERALRLLGPDTRIIYVTRDPIARIVSQYHHLWGLELEHRPLNEAVMEDPNFVKYSLYQWQLEPWSASFDARNILVLRFEDYIADRTATLAEICAFLGIAPPDEAVAAAHRNQSAGKRVARPGSVMSRIATSRLYLFGIKPLLPTGLRDRIKSALLPRARAMNDTLSDETRAWLEAELMHDPLAAAYLDRPAQRRP